MGATEKFCLRWNDFETNISVAFRELRDEKDFFDVTLACDDSSQVQAHKVILSACSPFFRQILRRNPHQHPLLYLKGVKYKELLAVLNFMYQGEVNVAQEELNSFLVVAEDLRVKGLTQNNSDGAATSASGRGSAAKSGASRVREPPDRGDPPAKRQRALAPAPSLLHAPTNSARAGGVGPSALNSFKKDTSDAALEAEDDDDIQEVVPTIVKSEPRESTSNSAMVTSGRDSGGGGINASEAEYGDDATGESHVGGGEVALEDSYQDESYDYGGGDYGDVSFGGEDGGGGVIDPNTGLPLGAGATDGNKDLVREHASHHDFELEILSKMQKEAAGWVCLDCGYTKPNKGHVIEHVEARHVQHPAYVCQLCGKLCTTRNTFRQHRRVHALAAAASLDF